MYDQFFVPALFAAWTEPMLDASGTTDGDDVLDVGCGTGVLALAARDRVGATGAVTGLDPNGGMLDIARRADPSVTWDDGVVEHLPYDEATFDRVLSQFVLMFVSDASRALREMRRVTRPGGTVTIATWAAVETSPGYAAMVDLIRELFGDQPADALLAPFTIGSVEALGSLITPVLPDATVSLHHGSARFPSIRAWVETDIRGWTLRDMIDDEQLQRLVVAAEERLARFADDDGRVAFAAPAVIATSVVRSPQ